MHQTSLNQPNPYAGIIEQTEGLLSTKYGQSLSLDHITPIQVEGRFLLLRCTVEPPQNDLPQSVVIKQMNSDLMADKRIEITQTSRNEQAVLQVLTDLSGPNRYGPTYYTGDHRTGLLVLEDLGDYPTLQDVLYGQDAHQAREVLVQYGGYLASMQLATRDRVGMYTANLRRFGATSQRDVLGWDLRDCLPDLHRCLRAFQIESTGEFDQAIHDLARSIQDPGPFYTLSHSDAGPHNIMVLPKQPILIDFESACFQHGFVDLVQARMAFPSAGLGRPSGQGVIEQLEMAYRKELIKGIPEAADDQVFERALVEACAQVLLTVIAESWQGSSSQFPDPVQSTPESDFRVQRLLTILHAFLHVAESLHQLPHIQMIAQQIYDCVSNRWPGVDLLPYFPVFQAAYKG